MHRQSDIFLASSGNKKGISVTPRILYMGTADARGHLMRAQLLTHALCAAGAQVEVITTSEYGQRFLAEFDITAALLSKHYAVKFDSAQNMLQRETDRNVLHYIFRPSRMLRDIKKLRALVSRVDLVVNDSFHPALMMMGLLPGWRKKIVHVYGTSLRDALVNNFDKRLPVWVTRIFRGIVNRLIDSAHARIEHDFAYDQPQEYSGNRYQLPTPVVVAASTSNNIQSSAAFPTASVYLNPHFQETALVEALEEGIRDAKLSAYCVGEGYANRSGWLALDTRWVEKAIQSDLIISAPGMATLSIALIYDIPILLVRTDQPEQVANAQRAVELNLRHEVVVWQRDKIDFQQQIKNAATQLLNKPGRPNTAEGKVLAASRMDHWVKLLVKLARPLDNGNCD